MARATKPMAILRLRMRFSTASYEMRSRANHDSKPSPNFFARDFLAWACSSVGICLGRGFSSRPHIIGESVRATKPETRTAPAKVRANSVKSLPVLPVEKAIGAKTAARVNVIATTA